MIPLYFHIILWFFAGAIFGYIYHIFHSAQVRKRIADHLKSQHDNHLQAEILKDDCPLCEPIKSSIARVYFGKYRELKEMQIDRTQKRMGIVAGQIATIYNDAFSGMLTSNDLLDFAVKENDGKTMIWTGSSSHHASDIDNWEEE
jgi:hypothetical protein